MTALSCLWWPRVRDTGESGGKSVQARVGEKSKREMRAEDRATRSARGSVPETGSGSASRPSEPRRRILVIDDEDRILDFIARGLRHEGYEVDVAADARDGLNAALANRYELIILTSSCRGSPGSPSSTGSFSESPS